MYFLGHMAWAYVFAALTWALIPVIKNKGRLVIPFVLLAGTLSDSDLLLGGLGIVHRTVTHSFLFWIVAFLPLFVIFRWKSIPYFAAVIQHFAFGDLLVGPVGIFWPFSASKVGFSFAMGSAVDVAFEIAGLLLALGIMFCIGDLKRILSSRKENILMLLPFLALLVSALYFIASRRSLGALTTFLFSSNSQIALVAGHLILVALIGASLFQGLRAFKRDRLSKKRKIRPLLHKSKGESA